MAAATVGESERCVSRHFSIRDIQSKLVIIPAAIRAKYPIAPLGLEGDEFVLSRTVYANYPS
jgi:hypothetical protein